MKFIDLSKIDRWFIDNMKQLVEMEEKIKKFRNNKADEEIKIPVDLLLRGKERWFFRPATGLFIEF